MPVPGFDLPAPLNYIVRDRADAVENPGFDYDVLVKPMEPRMMRAIWRIVRQREAAEDALQDALAIIWKKRDAVARHPIPRRSSSGSRFPRPSMPCAGAGAGSVTRRPASPTMNGPATARRRSHGELRTGT